MRSISLFEKIELDYKGTVFQHAICLFDIDHDGCNELCICNIDGDLHVFKGINSSKPWKVNKAVGPVVVLCGGTIRDCDENLLCSLDTEGKCKLYDVFNESDDKEDVSTVPVSPTPSSTSTHTGELHVVHEQILPPNARCAILEDIDNDGVEELIVGFTDRFVRIYKWQNEDDHGTAYNSSSSSKKMFINRGSKDETEKHTSANKTSKEDCEQRKPALSFSLSLTKEPKSKEILGTSLMAVKNDNKDETKLKDSSQTSSHGSFNMMKQFSLFSQVGTLAVCNTDDGRKLLIASQPNGCYCILETFDENYDFVEDSPETINNSSTAVIPTPESYTTFNPFITKHTRNYSYTSTEVIGSIKRGNEIAGVIGLCTLDGNFRILEESSLCNMYLKKNCVLSEHRWFSMSKIDVTNDGDDEIILCSMNGMTYMIDKEQNIVSYNFNRNVAAFCAGNYGPLGNNCSNNCLCYVTLCGKIHIYYNVWISAMKVKCVHGSLIEKLTQREDLKYILNELKLPNGDIDHQKIQTLVKKSININIKNINNK